MFSILTQVVVGAAIGVVIGSILRGGFGGPGGGHWGEKRHSGRTAERDGMHEGPCSTEGRHGHD